MTTSSSSAPAISAARSSVLAASADPATHIVAAARLILPHLERGCRIDAAILRIAMESAFGGSDADGAWDWKTAYDTCEAATVLFVRKFGAAMRSRAPPLLEGHVARCWRGLQASYPTTRDVPRRAKRSSNSARRSSSDLRLPPQRRSRRPGIVARTVDRNLPAPILAELSGAALVLNELADTRARLLSLLFPAVTVTRFDAAHIDDHLDAGVTPSIVLMNPPFSAVANVDRRIGDAALRHISSALSRLA